MSSEGKGALPEVKQFQRDDSFDLLKGLGIILMVWVHCRTDAISHFAYTFHMPLFLFVSGYFFKSRGFKRELSLDFKRIVVPYVFTCLVMLILAFVVFDRFTFGSLSKTALLSSLWGGAIWGHLLSMPEELFIGPLWFLMGLLWVRLMASVLFRFVKNDIVCGSIIFILAIVAKCAFEVFGHVPLSLLQSFGCLGFFYMGYLAKKYDLLNYANMKKILPVCLLCWLYCMTFSSLALHKCMYEGFYILDILSAWGIFCILFVLVKNQYCEGNWFWKIILFVGRNSIIVLCVHAVDHCMLHRWSAVGAQLIVLIGNVPVTILRLALAILLAYLLTRNKFIYEKIFCMKLR